MKDFLWSYYLQEADQDIPNQLGVAMGINALIKGRELTPDEQYSIQNDIWKIALDFYNEMIAGQLEDEGIDATQLRSIRGFHYAVGIPDC